MATEDTFAHHLEVIQRMWTQRGEELGQLRGKLSRSEENGAKAVEAEGDGKDARIAKLMEDNALLLKQKNRLVEENRILQSRVEQLESVTSSYVQDRLADNDLDQAFLRPATRKRTEQLNPNLERLATMVEEEEDGENGSENQKGNSKLEGKHDKLLAEIDKSINVVGMCSSPHLRRITSDLSLRKSYSVPQGAQTEYVNKTRTKIDHFGGVVIDTLSSPRHLRAVGPPYSAKITRRKQMVSSSHPRSPLQTMNRSPSPTKKTVSMPSPIAKVRDLDLSFAEHIEGLGESGEQPVMLEAPSLASGGREFFKKARAYLSSEEFEALLDSMRALNEGRINREETVKAAARIFGEDQKHLVLAFEKLLSGELPIY